MSVFQQIISCSLLTCLAVNTPVIGQDEITPLSGEARKWKIDGDDGVEPLNAKLVGLKEGVVTFEKPDGARLDLPLKKLDGDDRRAALIDRVGSGIVMIATKDVFGEPAGFGSGFVIHRSGMMLTNYHVIAGAGAVTITFRDHAGDVSAEVMSVDRKHDLAVLRVAQLPEDVHVVEIQSSELPSLGNTVWTLGHPNGLKNTAGWGQVSAIRRSDEMPANLRQVFKSPPESRWLQTTAVIAQGSSGGPLLNSEGKAIGVNTFLLSPQLGFALHISHARNAYAEAIQGKPFTLPVPPGEDENPLAWLSSEVAPILQTYSDALAEFKRVAPGMSQDAAVARYNEIRETYRQQFLSLARENPQGWPGIQSLAYAAQTSQGDETEDVLQEILDLALEHHIQTPRIKAVLQMVSGQVTDTTRNFCRSVIEKSPHEAVRISACVSLAVSQMQWLQYPDPASVELSALTQCREEVEAICKELEKIASDSSNEKYQRDGGLLANQLRQQLGQIQTGLESPEIHGVDSKGTEFKLSDYRGKVVLLDFFADWCPHCKRMYPNERQMVEELKDRPFVLLGVHCESEQVLQKLVNDKTVTWRSWADGQGGPIANQWAVEGFPTMILLDENGLIRYRWGGAPDEKELRELVEEMVTRAEVNPAG